MEWVSYEAQFFCTGYASSSLCRITFKTNDQIVGIIVHSAREAGYIITVMANAIHCDAK